MDARVEPTPEESRRLQRCINDLIGLLALPAVWGDSDPSRIVRTSIDALLGYSFSGVLWGMGAIVVAVVGALGQLAQRHRSATAGHVSTAA